LSPRLQSLVPCHRPQGPEGPTASLGHALNACRHLGPHHTQQRVYRISARPAPLLAFFEPADFVQQRNETGMVQGAVMADFNVATARGQMPAYLVAPQGDGPWPGVVVLHDAAGVSSDLRSQAD